MTGFQHEDFCTNPPHLGQTCLAASVQRVPLPVTDRGGYVPPMDSPEDGHTFTITYTSRMSSSIEGVPGHRDADWESEPKTVRVRAWDLRHALRLAATLPMSAWYPEE